MDSEERYICQCGMEYENKSDLLTCQEFHGNIAYVKDDNKELKNRLAAVERERDRLKEILTEIQSFNHLHNDLDAYLYHLGEYGLGIIDKKPNPADFGL